MKEIVNLKKPYICVEGQSYGGSQNYFKESSKALDKRRYMAGCGIVAAGDVVAYLKNKTVFSNIPEYKKYFKKTAAYSLWIPNKFGMSFFQEVFALFIGLTLNRLPYTCFWGFSRRKLYPRIKTMLSEDIPVILCIPRVIGRARAQKERLGLFRYQKSKEALVFFEATNGHFVVVTGICEIDKALYLRVSSWGYEYYIKYDEYVTFLKKHLFGLLGNIMCVRHR